MTEHSGQTPPPLPPSDPPLPPSDNVSQTDRRRFWRANLIFTSCLLLIWFSVSFGAGILFRGFLDQFSIGGAPLGFWFAQQGSITVFVILIFVYCYGMGKLEQKFNIKR